MFERDDDVLYVCYDNGGYMNTGVQRSGATPVMATTTTTPAGQRRGQGKSLPLIAMAHEIPYVATASVADLRDLEDKVTTAMSLRGARYLHVLVPCPLGWESPPAKTIELARLATQCGLFPLFEARDGDVVASTPIRRPVPVTAYLEGQARFAHLFSPTRREDVLDELQAAADRTIARFDLLREAS
jgi:pyruvate ferredoxin oxidoreductase beta subunit